MIVCDYGPGGSWYVESRTYPTAAMAKRAWERAERKLDMSAGDEGIGIYRLAPNPEGGLTTGAGGKHAVAMVTLDEATARKARRILSDGEPWDPEPDFARALILRRARVVKQHAGETGRVLIRRGRGARLDDQGVMTEPVGGEG